MPTFIERFVLPALVGVLVTVVLGNALGLRFGQRVAVFLIVVSVPTYLRPQSISGHSFRISQRRNPRHQRMRNVNPLRLPRSFGTQKPPRQLDAPGLHLARPAPPRVSKEAAVQEATRI